MHPDKAAPSVSAGWVLASGLALFAGVALVMSGTTKTLRSIWPWPVAAIPIVLLGAVVPFPCSPCSPRRTPVRILLLAAQTRPAADPTPPWPARTDSISSCLGFGGRRGIRLVLTAHSAGVQSQRAPPTAATMAVAAGPRCRPLVRLDGEHQPGVKSLKPLESSKCQRRRPSTAPDEAHKRGPYG